MNRKTIKSLLKKKHEEFVNSIDDDRVRKLVNKNAIITGGAIASMLLNETVNDYDYYFTDKETVLAVAEYYANRFNAENKDHVVTVLDHGHRVELSGNLGSIDVQTRTSDTTNEQEEKYVPIFLTPNAITLSGKVQLVIRFYGKPDDIHKTYDFVHCMNYWLSRTGELVLNPEALESLLTKQLFYKGSEYPLCSILRTRKFIKRGWHINAGQYAKMCLQLNDLDLLDINVLKDQLAGVDIMYFMEVISAIEKMKADDDSFKLSSSYLIKIIDRIF